MSPEKDFDQYLKQNLQSISKKMETPDMNMKTKNPKFPRSFWKSGVAVAACVVLLTGAATGAAAFWPSWFDGSVDKGLQQAEEQGKMQHPKTVVTDQETTVTLQSVSTDALRTVLVMQVHGKGSNVLALDEARLFDEKGREYGLQKATEAGQMEFAPFETGVSKGILKVTSISKQKGNWTLEFPVTRYVAHTIEPKQTVDLGDGNSLIIQKMDFSATALKVDITYNSAYKAIGMSVIENGVEHNMTSYDRDQQDANVGHYLLEPAEGARPMTIVLKFEGRPEVRAEIVQP